MDVVTRKDRKADEADHRSPSVSVMYCIQGTWPLDNAPVPRPVNASKPFVVMKFYVEDASAHIKGSNLKWSVSTEPLMQVMGFLPLDQETVETTEPRTTDSRNSS